MKKGQLDIERLNADARELLTDQSYAELELLIAEFG